MRQVTESTVQHHSGAFYARSVSLTFYFYAGDFESAVQARLSGAAQTYATHNDLVDLFLDLIQRGHHLRLVTFQSKRVRTATPIEGLELCELGGSGWDDSQRLLNDLDGHDPDRVFVHFPSEELLAALISRGLRSVAVLADSFGEPTWLNRLRHRRIVAQLNRPNIEWVTNHCEPATRHLADLGVAADKLIAWQSRLPNHPDDHPDRQFDIGPEPELVYVGSISPEKGVLDLVQSVKLLVDAGRPVRVRIIGAGALDDVQRLAASEGVADRVIIEGQLTNAEAVHAMQQCAAVVVPSRQSYPEGMPLTLFEALAVHTPIICSDHIMFRPIFVDGENAAIFEASSPAALASAVQRLLGDPAEYERLSSASAATWQRLHRTVDLNSFIRAWIDDDESWLAARTVNRLA